MFSLVKYRDYIAELLGPKRIADEELAVGPRHLVHELGDGW